MNKITSVSYILLSVAIAGCNGLGKMAKNFSTVKHEVTPDPLELKGDSVSIAVKGTFPAKYFAKKVDVTATPSIKTSSGSHDFKSVTIVGEKSQTSGDKINYKAGGSFSYSDRIAYTPDMKAGDVMLKMTGKKGTTTKELGEVKIADATIVTQLLVQHDEKVIAAKDQFVRVTPANFDGVMYYLINTSRVNPAFKNKECNFNNKQEFAKIDSAINVLSMAPYTLKGISIMGYASPDGTEKLNTTLSVDRGKSSAKYISDLYKKRKIKMSPDSSFFTLNSTHEDWAGFQQLMQSSSMPQKDMILRIVASNADPDAREIEIKKMGKAYTEIAEGVLPKLRRSAITLNADKVGRSDAEISALAKSNPDSLSVEELLYAGTLTKDLNEQLNIYKAAERIYPQDWRCANNAGIVMFWQKNVDGAMAEFNKADQLKASNPVVKNNIGACYSRKDDRKNAAMSYEAASGAGPEVANNMGILDIKNGNYSAAVGHYGSTNSFNAALAKLLSGDKDGAMNTINASDDKDSAMGHYLMAVISARKADASGVTTNLSSATSKDASLKAMAAEDREFVKWFKDSSFQNVVK